MECPPSAWTFVFIGNSRETFQEVALGDDSLRKLEQQLPGRVGVQSKFWLKGQSRIGPGSALLRLCSSSQQVRLLAGWLTGFVVGFGNCGRFGNALTGSALGGRRFFAVDVLVARFGSGFLQWTAARRCFSCRALLGQAPVRPCRRSSNMAQRNIRGLDIFGQRHGHLAPVHARGRSAHPAPARATIGVLAQRH